MYNFKTIKEFVDLAEKNRLSLAEVVIRREMNLFEKDREEVEDKMKKSLMIMQESIEQGLQGDVRSMSGLTGGDAKMVNVFNKEGKSIIGNIMSKAVARALAVSEINASMGRIVAIPTAGSCGILPGSLLVVADSRGVSKEKVIEALFVASGIGLVVAEQASISGAEGGCQAECGTATAMAAAAITYVMGGDNLQIMDAAAIGLKCILGLVCDPVAGLVEVPCIKRNAMGASNALVAAEMALAGVKSLIPLDEVILAMDKVGRALPETLRETSLGGLAVTKTACQIRKDLIMKS